MAEQRFVVHEHHARQLHYDFRLEMDGVRRLAVRVDDHPLSYIDFQGRIPEGQYGAGTVAIWDRGTYTLASRSPRELIFVRHGTELNGPYAPVRFMRQPSNWLLLKRGEE
jgi:DNA ligase D-like protein (predicted 3'-phosphoesterase)